MELSWRYLKGCLKLGKLVQLILVCNKTSRSTFNSKRIVGFYQKSRRCIEKDIKIRIDQLKIFGNSAIDISLHSPKKKVLLCINISLESKLSKLLTLNYYYLLFLKYRKWFEMLNSCLILQIWNITIRACT